MLCCSRVLIGTNRMFGGPTASQIASASATSVLLSLTEGLRIAAGLAALCARAAPAHAPKGARWSLLPCPRGRTVAWQKCGQLTARQPTPKQRSTRRVNTMDLKKRTSLAVSVHLRDGRLRLRRHGADAPNVSATQPIYTSLTDATPSPHHRSANHHRAECQPPSCRITCMLIHRGGIAVLSPVALVDASNRSSAVQVNVSALVLRRFGRRRHPGSLIVRSSHMTDNARA
jgi:hypothetical protein